MSNNEENLVISKFSEVFSSLIFSSFQTPEELRLKFKDMRDYFENTGVASILKGLLVNLYIERPEDPKAVLLKRVALEISRERYRNSLLKTSPAVSGELSKDPETSAQKTLYQSSPSDAIDLTPFVRRQHEIPESDLSPPITPPAEVVEIKLVVQGKFCIDKEESSFY